jgi:AcrB/AcrD/AcrF family
MISDFFIERPVLANVLAILMVVIGAVALFALPVAQYPDVVPPTVQVTTRYPGASARTVVDAVALPIEQQVNGVEGMIYMQSFSAADGSYSLTVTFRIGVDLNLAQVLVQNRVSSALASLPQAVQAQGVVVQKNSTAILQIVTLASPDQRYDSLYLANYATIKLRDEIARLPGVGNVVVFGAGQYSMRIWLDPNKMQARGLVPQDVVQALQQQSAQVTAGQIGAPPAPSGQTFQYTLNVRQAQRPRAIRRHHRQDRPHRRDHAPERRRARRAWIPDLWTGLRARRQAGGGSGDFPGAGSECARGRDRGAQEDGGARARVPAGTRVRHPVRHHEVRRAIHPRGVQDAVRGRDPRSCRHTAVPAGLARDADTGNHGAGDHRRRFRRHGGARLHHQFLDPVRDRAGHRHRGGRRHRGGGGRGPQHREGHARPRSRECRHAPAARPDRRHHAGADVGVPAGGVPARPDRAHVRAVRAGDRGHRLHQRHQRRDPEADAGRHVAAPGGRAGAAQPSLPRVQPPLWRDRALVRATDRPHGPPQRADDGPGVRAHCRNRLRVLAFRPASCRSRTRAI